MNKIRYINMCITEFGKRNDISPFWAYQYLKKFCGLSFLDKCYEAEHQFSLNDTLSDLKVYCKRHGGTLWWWFSH